MMLILDPTRGRASRLVFKATALASIAFFTAACYGRFPLTKGIYDWNGNVGSDRYVRSLIFVVTSPAYVLFALGDALIINPIEFWTGERVVNAAQVQPDGTTVYVNAAPDGQTGTLLIVREGEVIERHQLAVEKDKLTVRGDHGEIIAYASI